MGSEIRKGLKTALVFPMVFLLCLISGGMVLARDESKDLLRKFDNLPDLGRLATKEAGEDGDGYAIQKRLAQEYRSKGKAFKLTMPYRHMTTCSTGEHRVGAAKYTLVNPRGKKWLFFGEKRLEIWEREIHEIRFHGSHFSQEQKIFLEKLKI